MGNELRILLREDVASDAELEVRQLERAGIACVARRVETEADFRAQLDEFSPDVILSDFTLPGFDGLLALRIARELRRGVPFIFVSGTIGEDLAVESLKSGAADYVLKANLARLPQAVVRVAGDAASRRERTEQAAKIARLTRIHAVLSNINALVLRVKHRGQLFAGACHIVVQYGGFGMAWIGAADAASGDIDCLAYASADGTSPQAQIAHKPNVTTGMGVCARSMREQHAVCRNDLRAEGVPAEPWTEHAMRNGYHSALALPVKMEDAVAASLVLYAREADFFNQDEIDLLLEVAGNVSFGLSNIEKGERISRLDRTRAFTSGINSLIVREQDRDALFDGACRIAIEQGQFELAWIGLYDAATSTVTPVAAQGRDAPDYIRNMMATVRPAHSPGRGELSRAIAAKQPCFCNDMTLTTNVGGERRQQAIARGYRSYLVLPLLSNDRVMGTLALMSKETNIFTDEEMKLLVELKENLSFALESLEKDARLNQLAYYDVLTGLPNRSLYRESLTRALAQAVAHHSPLAVIFLDLDRFKNVNDTLGHATGDELLRQVGERLMNCVRIRDTVARLSGDEFGLILSNATSVQDSGRVTRKIRDAMREPFDLDGRQLTVTASIGIAVFPNDAADADTLIKYADTAMYRAKESGRDTYRFYTRLMNARALERLELENALRSALTRREFVLHYQPKMDIRSRRCTGVEALLRWNRAERELVLPGEFMPLLEETGLIVPVGAWIIDAACKQIAEWQRTGPGPIPIAVNLSAQQFRVPDWETGRAGGAHTGAAPLLEFESQATAALQAYGIAPDLLEFELTESTLMTDAASAVQILDRLKSNGMRLAIDDFGTGYSSLAYLKRFPIDTLKVDRAFISDVTTNENDATIAVAIINLAHSLGVRVVAEGVESAEQLEFLRVHLCDEFQGYYLARPMPAAQLTALLVHGNSLMLPCGSGDA